MTDQLAPTETENATPLLNNRPLSEAEQAERVRISEAFQRWGLLIGNATSVAEIKAAFLVMDTELPETLAGCPELAKIT